MKINSKVLLLVVVLLVVSMPVLGQNKLDNVRLFQSFFYDAPIAKTGYAEAGLEYADYDGMSKFGIGGQGGYPINEKIEVGASLQFLSLSPEEGDGQSGISDLGAYGRYNLIKNGKTNFSAGALVTLPIGSEDIGQGNLNFGAFGAVRHALDNGMVIVGNAGLIFYEVTKVEYDFDFSTGDYTTEESTSYENYLNLSGGAIYPVNELLNIVGELTFRSEGDYMMLSGGGDYLMGNGHLRGALGIGLDNGAPDLMIMGGYLIAF
ncbi:MAG: hypothetical protein ACOY90_11055 [Candidatus Zhuqueibacterota bacterium]